MQCYCSSYLYVLCGNTSCVCDPNQWRVKIFKRLGNAMYRDIISKCTIAIKQIINTDQGVFWMSIVFICVEWRSGRKLIIPIFIGTSRKAVTFHIVSFRSKLEYCACYSACKCRITLKPDRFWISIPAYSCTWGAGSNHSGLGPRRFCRLCSELTLTAPVPRAKITESSVHQLASTRWKACKNKRESLTLRTLKGHSSP